jgi:hypothetical protein
LDSFGRGHSKKPPIQFNKSQAESIERRYQKLQSDSINASGMKMMAMLYRQTSRMRIFAQPLSGFKPCYSITCPGRIAASPSLALGGGRGNKRLPPKKEVARLFFRRLLDF